MPNRFEYLTGKDRPLAIGRKLIFINAPPRAGKDTARLFYQQYLLRLPEFTSVMHYKMSSPIKRAVCAAFDQDFSYLEEHKDEVLDILHGKTFRQLQISFSEDWLKKFYDPAIFGRIAGRNISNTASDFCIIDDCGFIEELNEAVRYNANRNVLLLRIHRPGCDFNNDSRSYLFPAKHIVPAQCDINNDDDLFLYHTKLGAVIDDWLAMRAAR